MPLRPVPAELSTESLIERTTDAAGPAPSEAAPARADPADPAAEVARASEPRRTKLGLKPSWAAIGSFLILLMGAIYFAQDVIVPIVLSFVLALVLSPIVRFGQRYHVPAGATAGGLVMGAAALVAGGLYMVSEPLTELITSAPRIVEEVEEKLRSVGGSVTEAMSEAEGAEGASGLDDPEVQEVVVKQPGLLTSAAYGAPEVLAKIVLSLALLFFLLASGDLFYEKLVKVIPRFKDKKRAIKIAYTVERTLSRYLFTITLINAGLGVAIAGAMWWLGMPNPVIWGVLSFGMNFIPYVGAVVGVAFSGLVALVTFDDPTRALVVPLVYLACTSLEGQFVTPAVVGQRLKMNAVAIFIGVAFWGWMWGVVGMLIAVPMMVALKIVSDNTPGLSGLAEFLGGRQEDEEAAA